MDGTPADISAQQFVMFRLADEEYGLPIDRVQSIIRYEEPTPVPHAPPYVEGVINLRGKVIPVVDLAMRLLDRVVEHTSYTRIIVADAEVGTIGLTVDFANEVASVPVSEIRPAPESALTPETAEAFEGVASHEGRLVILLNPDKALPKPEFLRTTMQEGETDV